MADSHGVPTEMMLGHRSFISDNGVDNFDTASQGSKDECVEHESGFTEERFRVDRKKLEQMLQLVPGEECIETAEDFFQRVMEESNTQITWPSKLKIGAKSKKDPHIKVIGFPDDVRAAKAKIMSILDTKSNRVTLKMDVSHTEHSHVIGKGGNNIKRVMAETGCHIHFPDSNRGSNVQEKSNQVSIAGQPAGVENARAQIRELLPLSFQFEVGVVGGLSSQCPDSSWPGIQQLQQLYNVSISFKQRGRMTLLATVRGSVINAKSVREATASLLEMLTGRVDCGVCMHLEIAPQHHMFMVGRAGANIRSIMAATNAKLLFPDPSKAGTQRNKGTVLIEGTIDSVFCARQLLIGCLPLVLMFDVKEEIELEQGRLAQLMEQLDVFISVKPKPKQPSKSVIVKSIERNASNMYLARTLLLGLHPEGLSSQMLKAAANSRASAGLGISTLGFLSSHGLLNVSTNNSVLLMNHLHHPLPQPPPPHSPSLPPPPSPLSPGSQWIQHPATGMFSPVMMVSPPNSVQPSFDVRPACNGLHKDFATSPPFIGLPPSSHNHCSSNQSDTASPPSASPCSSPQSVLGFRSPPSDGAVLGGDCSMDHVITRDTSHLSGSGHTLDLLGLSKTTPLSPPQQPPVTATLFSNMHGLQNGDKSGESSGAESDGSDKRAPGSERHQSSSSLFPTPLVYPFDYEQKKLQAMKAMQKKPEGESRIPTDMWAGMGFSKSMPESAIREKLGQLGVPPSLHPLLPQHPIPEASPPPDLSSEDYDRDPWRDSTKAASAQPFLNRAPGEFPSLRHRKYDYALCQQQQQQHQHQQQQQQPQHPPGPGLHPGSSSGAPQVLGERDLAELFSTLGLGKYTDKFQQQEIDLATFQTLTDQDLKELGIATFGARRKMLLAIADLNNPTLTLQQPSPGRSTNNPYPHSAMSSPRRQDLASLSGRW